MGDESEESRLKGEGKPLGPLAGMPSIRAGGTPATR